MAKMATDRFEWKTNYLIVVDYSSLYTEMARRSTSTSNDAITHLKSTFTYHGIPQAVMSDNGPQYAAAAFVKGVWIYSHHK